MKKIDTSYTIELTTKEVNVIVDEFHFLYKMCKEGAEKGECDAEHLRELRDIRNSFASLINRSYMGKDA